MNIELLIRCDISRVYLSIFLTKNYFHLHLIVADIFVKRFYRNKKRWIDLQMAFDVPSLECAILLFQAR